MNTLIDSDSLDSLCDERYSLASINKVAYQVFTEKVGSDQTILACTGLTVGELKSIKRGHGSIELLQRTCSDLYLQFIYGVSDVGIQARIKASFVVYRLTP